MQYCSTLYLCAGDVVHLEGQRFDGAAAERVAFAVLCELAQLALLVRRQLPAVARVAVVRRQLQQQLPHPVSLAHAAHVRNAVLRKRAEVLVHLQRADTVGKIALWRNHPILLKKCYR